MSKLLNIGAPYLGLTGGDKQRARFEASVLSEHYRIRDVYIEEGAPPPRNSEATIDGDLTLYFEQPRWPWQTGPSVFPQSEVNILRAVLEAERPDVIFFRYLAGTTLLPAIQDLLSSTRIVIDADMLISRIAKQAWASNRSIRNRYFFFASIRDARYERWLFNQPYLFFMSNEAEMGQVLDSVRRPDAPSEFVLVPNPMPTLPGEFQATPAETGHPYILFHGVLSSMVNLDAFRYLAHEIYPLIAQKLEEHGVEIHVVGRNMSSEYESMARCCQLRQIRLVGEVDDIGKAIQGAAFCIAPLRIGSGTKTRILEVAAYGRAVITTPIGAEGLRFDESALVVKERAPDLARAIIQLIEDTRARDRLAQNLHTKSLAEYSEHAIGERMLASIDTYLS